MASITVIIPSYNPLPEHLAALFDSLKTQSLADFEVILVDDASKQADYSLLSDMRFRIIYREKNGGPAICRNAGARATQSDYLFFTDTDCVLEKDTLREAAEALQKDAIITGNTITRVKTPFGCAVALLGFPGGGSIGFDRVWRVDAAGYAVSFSSCNLAIRRATLEKAGYFDESFPLPGGEDTVLARHMADSGYRFRYNPRQIIYHVEKSRLNDFIRWQITRGRGNYHIRRRVSKVGGYLRLRVWTFHNSLTQAGWKYAGPVALLIILSVLLQCWGYWREKNRWAKAPSAPSGPTA